MVELHECFATCFKHVDLTQPYPSSYLACTQLYISTCNQIYTSLIYIIWRIVYLMFIKKMNVLSTFLVNTFIFKITLSHFVIQIYTNSTMWYLR